MTTDPTPYSPQPATDGLCDAISDLGDCAKLIELARDNVARAARGLEGARNARAVELLGKLDDAQAFAERLKFVAIGDLRADEAVDAAVQRHPAGDSR
ncbi:hypothetical protein [Mycobacterium marseillense]|uniref:hypothetical protein n=1 Tax=Mycobacterium marseillense TaxID=701042 RepID=UPI001F4FE68A|nr:hypothetical protein [Mycobacterium marseillense]